ncbi:hypothetical protein ASPCAL07797 [Aspergillus calidoustus]|uniref:Zn(2)-C6 fungal-type domain-containing protein n=1 Tax=Aspergillus calidoustus TaxID=454130 RepID=A0A0U5CPL9_ASPCI|nr:hypothetical protein ASPCAL07797 [Aspergillus calidoustus]
MYREPRRLANILKCRFCRRDKRRCLPENRVWPGQKCEACERYGYDCSIGLSAEQEKAEQQRQAHRRQQSVVAGGGSQQGIVANAYTHTRQIEGRDDATTWTAPTQEARPLQTVPSEQLIKLRPDATNPNSLTLYIPRAAGRRMEFAGTLDLEERLMRLWANPETYEQACSSRLAITCSELFIHIRRIAESDELIFSSLFAFIAGNLGVYANRPIALQLESASRQYLERSFNMLKTYMDQAAQSPNGTPRPGTILPMQYACFLLACYGSSTSEPQMIEFMVKQLEFLRKYSASFPLRLGVVLQPPNGWRFRIHLAEDPTERGIEIGHDTKVFRQAMIQAKDEAFPS